MKARIAGKFSIGAAILAARLLGKKRPVSIGWAVTKRCNLQCVYCDKHDGAGDIPTGEALSLCDQFADAGARYVNLTGGEPLLREDLPALIRRLRNRGIYVSLSTNGALAVKNLETVRMVNRLNVSLDGPEEVHDPFRGQGSFEGAVAAINAARLAGVHVVINSVLHALNTRDIAALLETARERGCRVNVQPISVGKTLSDGNPAIPRPEQLRMAVRRLIDAKRTGDPNIENSQAGLRHMMEWPSGPAVACMSSAVSCRVEPDGRVHHCGNVLNELPQTDYRRGGFLEAFKSLPPRRCAGCWCANRYELNRLASLRPRSMMHVLNRF